MKTPILPLLIFITLLTSCKKEETADIRDSVNGEYSGIEVYTINYSTLSSSYIDTTHKRNVVVTVNSDSNNGFSFTEDQDNVIIKAIGVKEASNGICFKIPLQDLSTFGIIQGYKNYPMDGLQFDGMFTSSNMIFGFSGILKVKVEGVLKDVPFTCNYELTPSSTF